MNYLGALGAGYTTQQILNYISQSFPELGNRVKDAIASGKSAEEVLKYLGKFDKRQFASMKGSSKINKPFPEVGYETPYAQGQKSTKELNPIPESIQTAASMALPIAGGLAAAPMIKGLASQASPMIKKAMQHAAPSLFGPGAITNPEKNQGESPPLSNTNIQTPTSNQLPKMATNGQNNLLQSELSSSQQSPVNINIPQKEQVKPPEVINTDLIKNNVTPKTIIDKLMASGNGADEIDAYLRKFHPKIVSSMEKNIKHPLKDVIESYIQQSHPQSKQTQQTISPVEGATQPEVSTSLPTEEMPNVVDEEIEPVKIEKGSEASSPKGFGTVLEVRGNEAILEIDGKRHKVSLDQLENSPLPEKHLAELYDDLIKGIQHETGEDVSRMVQWAGYNPDTNTLSFLPHTGKMYKYSDISKEDAELLRDILSTRKTSGANFIGAWKAGSKSPIGAALSKLIRKLQSERGGKGNEYEESVEPIYSAYEPAIQAKKKKKIV